jgi:D-3-phosphoglycerate dehydrogenase
MKVVVPEKISKRGIDVLETAGFTVVQLTPAAVASGELARELVDADALIVRSAVKVNAALLEGAPKLRVIGRAGVGVDNVDVAAATARKIVVMNTPGGSSVAVAELALGLMLALARQIPRADQTTRAGQWEKKSLEGTELSGKTLGLVGFGRIAVEVARRARCFDMPIVAYDPVARLQAAREAGAAMVPLEELLAQSDYISLHVSLTPESQNLFNDRTFAQMKRGVKIINCARGEVIDEAALARALESGQVGGVALDVYRNEPPGPLPLFSLANVIATPHLGASTREAQERVGTAIAIQIKEYLQDGKLTNAVTA